MKKTYFSYLDSPIGRLRLEGDGEALLRIGFRGDPEPGDRSPEIEWVEDPVVLARAAAQLDAYFRGELREFDLPVLPAGTPFQRKIWARLALIPYGQTISYGRLAAELGLPGAARAVGAACGRNPVPIVIPCHRVIGENLRLTGYRGGLEIKRALLELESAASPGRELGQGS